MRDFGEPIHRSSDGTGQTVIADRTDAIVFHIDHANWTEKDIETLDRYIACVNALAKRDPVAVDAVIAKAKMVVEGAVFFNEDGSMRMLAHIKDAADRCEICEKNILALAEALKGVE